MYAYIDVRFIQLIVEYVKYEVNEKSELLYYMNMSYERML